MRNFIKISLFIIVFVLVKTTFSQDIHFSQFYASPLSLSPYQTGNYNGDWRFMHNYRTQWRSISEPFNTISVGYDRNFYIYNEQLSGGIFFINDKSGDASLTINKIYLSMAYHKTINNNNLHFGIQPGYVMKSFGVDGTTFPNQFDMTSGQFSSDLDNNETTLEEDLSYFDINAGVAWSRKFNKIEPIFGLSFFHITHPKESFLPDNNHLPMRTSIYGGANFDIFGKIVLMPHLIYMRHKRATEFLLGNNFGYKFKENEFKINMLYAGLFFRDGLDLKMDAFIAVAGIRVYNFDIGFSYDFNISPLKVATGMKGALEFSLIYTGASTLLQKIAIPCDRY